MVTRQFWIQTLERAVKTFAQALAAVLVAGGAGLLSADWRNALSVAGMAALVSVLTSVASVRIGPAGSPSVVGEGPPPAGPVAAPVPLPVPRDELPQAA